MSKDSADKQCVSQEHPEQENHCKAQKQRMEAVKALQLFLKSCTVLLGSQESEDGKAQNLPSLQHDENVGYRDFVDLVGFLATKVNFW